MRGSPASRRRPLLPGVVVAGALALASAGAPLPAQPGEGAPAGPLAAAVDRRQDEVIARGLEQRLRQLPELRQVEVTAEAGVVTLTGEALSTAALEEAGRIARRTEGVADVLNRITVVRDVRERVVPALAKLQQRFQDFLAWLPVLGVALAILVAFWFLARWIAGWERLFRRLSHNRFVQDLVSNLVRAAVLVAGALLALEVLDATALVGAVLGAAGVAGLAVGFAFRDLVENYIASILLSVRQPFAPNDLVEIDGRQGKVVRLTSRATILMTLDGNHLRIPNAQVFKGVILNYSRNPLRRFDFSVGVGAGEDLEAAQSLGVEALLGVEGVLGEPAPWSQVENLGDWSVILRYYAWVDQRRASFVKVRSRAVNRVKATLEEAGVDLPEPIYRLVFPGGEGMPSAAPRPAAEARAPAAPAGEKPRPEKPSVEVVESVTDVSAGDAIDRQIADERAAPGEEDLLDPRAPRE